MCRSVWNIRSPAYVALGTLLPRRGGTCAAERVAGSRHKPFSTQARAKRSENTGDDVFEDEIITITEKEAHERIDKVLAARYPEYSRNNIQNLIKNKSVRAQGDPVKKSAKYAEGCELEVVFTEPTDRSVLVPNDLPLRILFEDEHILVLDKEPGMVVHPAPGNWEGTLVNALVHRYRSTAFGDEGSLRPGIVHRLDKETSGVMIVARTPEAHRNLEEQFRNRSVKKTYLAVTGRNPLERGEISRRISFPLGRHPQLRTKMAVVPESKGGRLASTIVYHVASDERNLTTLVRVVLETGRTHQIRVHLKEVRAPILGDSLYGYTTFNDQVRTLAKRVMLHAYKLELTHPISGEQHLFTAPVPEDFFELVEKRVDPNFRAMPEKVLAASYEYEKRQYKEVLNFFDG
mmetsp:Transcript_5966/g.17963  ORF Transcript_5966/g.17963 Transcript_5966/m.17963 type:complete len:404 (+) Transcript_5966:73-1284(+)